MKAVALCVFALLATAYTLEQDEVLKKWQQFQADYGKSYKSPLEARKRFTIFNDNLKQIDSHNELFENGQSSYSAGINQFTDWTQDEFMKYVNIGLTNKPVIVGDIFNKSGSFAAPESVDWREKNAVTGVKDQGQCGSCWSFSTTGSIEGQLALVKGELIPLSEQNLMDCSWQQGNMGCGGGLMTNAFEYVKKNGIESEADYPYEEYDDKCKADPSKVVTKISSYTNIRQGDEADLQEAIASKGPISVAIDATSRLQMYGSGIFDDRSCSTTALNHGVLAVGFGTENGTPYYIIKNSWGKSWGESGYFRMVRNKNNKCGVASMASYPTL